MPDRKCEHHGAVIDDLDGYCFVCARESRERAAKLADQIVTLVIRGYTTHPVDLDAIRQSVASMLPDA